MLFMVRHVYYWELSVAQLIQFFT